MASRAKIRASVVLAVACATAAAATLPTVDWPFRHLANYRADTADPIWDNVGSPKTDGAALRRAGALLPDRATYYLDVPPTPPPGLVHDVTGAALLFFTPALPVVRPADAQWVLNYRRRPLLPPGLAARRVYKLGDGIFLVQVSRA